MSTVELGADPKKSPQTPEMVLTDAERTTANKLGANPMDLLGTTESKAYIKGLIEEALPTSKAFQNLAAAIASPPGTFLLVPDDLTANAAEYVYTDTRTELTYLYCNGAAVSQTTYADLYAFWGASKYAADSGGNFSLPDTRGRALWLAGTHADVDLGDNDGVTESSRRPAHTHTSTSLTVTGAPAVGSLALPNHVHGASSGSFMLNFGSADVAGGGGFYRGDSTAANTGNPTSSPAVTGAPAIGTLDVGGTAGTGMSGSDAVAHIVIGSLVVRF